MKTLVSGLLALTAFAAAGAANAADLPAPPVMYNAVPVAPIPQWQGFYIGANGGGASGRGCWTFIDTVPAGIAGPSAAEGCHDPTGGFFGGQIGYNWQINGWVFGAEAQGDWANLRGQSISLPFPTTTNHTQIDALGLFTGRLGYAWGPALLYAKGGAALVHSNYDFSGTLFGASASGNAPDTRLGGTVGGGIEYKFTSNLSGALEYDFVMLGMSRRTFTTSLGIDAIVDVNQNLNLVSARLNYSFP